MGNARKWVSATAVFALMAIGHALGVDGFGISVFEEKRESGKSEFGAKGPTMRNSNESQREYVLEVISLGVTIEKYRQDKVWDALTRGSAHTSIREQDPQKYPWTRMDKLGLSGGRISDAIENAVKFTPYLWNVPSMYAGSTPANPDFRANEYDEPLAGPISGAEQMGLAFHLIVIGPWREADSPDQLLADVFDFMDSHPDLPYVIVSSADSTSMRDQSRLPRTPRLIEEGYSIPSMPDSAAAFVLARRERVDPVRPYVWDDPQNNYCNDRLRMFYYDVAEKVPKLISSTWAGRNQPMVKEWLPAAAKFAQTAPRGGLFKPGPPKDWKPTPWFPIPWTREQLSAFDRLPTLGYLHRPVFVKYQDAQGKAVHHIDDRAKLLNQGWQQALLTLPESERKHGPARVIAATGEKKDGSILLHRLLHDYAQSGGPAIDTSKTSQFIDMQDRIGNTGAATFFVGAAIGVLGSVKEGGVSAVINLRDPDGASIVFISPPNDANRKRADLTNRVMPAINLDDYAHP
ncbi:DUF2875 family protein [Massilia sp. TS11]|uniref:type VI lipase adapter Tla3 domain-containing protein n=1 Tax=Massilia sp. TS11 TaxID=2908003 RepID=UPI001EDA431C|nr:DUF2875 family protein [Massilia sp. TS11]MCG2586843.1 DUF2875 family protein [Massilia sp. TS11]